jgi:hypothetical protein
MNDISIDRYALINGFYFQEVEFNFFGLNCTNHNLFKLSTWGIFEKR